MKTCGWADTLAEKRERKSGMEISGPYFMNVLKHNSRGFSIQNLTALCKNPKKENVTKLDYFAGKSYGHALRTSERSASSSSFTISVGL